MVSIDLPGIQDTAKAKDLLGSNATISFLLLRQILREYPILELNGIPMKIQKYYFMKHQS